MKIEDLTQEQTEQFRACKTYEEFTALADELGLEFDEGLTETVRLLFEDPEALAARMEQVSAAAEDADITEDELKAVSGGYDDSGYWVVIQKMIHPAYTRKIVMDVHDKYMNVW